MPRTAKRWYYVLVASPVIAFLGMFTGIPVMIFLCVPVTLVGYIGSRASQM